MFLFICLGFLAVSNAIPTPQILTPAAALSAIPATNHILILTPQAQVQLEPSLKYTQPLVQHLAPVARIDSPTDQTVVYYPNENLAKPKQLESANITNIVNQFVSAGQTAQAQLEAFQQQLSQGLESLIQPTGQKADTELDSLQPVLSTDKLAETPRQDGGRFYSIPSIPQFYSNFEVIHTPVNPLFTVQPYQPIRARSVVHPEDKILVNAPQSLADINLAKIAVKGENVAIQSKPLESDQARSADNLGIPVDQPNPESVDTKSHKIQKEHEKLSGNSQFGKYLGSLENSAASQEIQSESIKKEGQNIQLKEQTQGSELVSFAEAIPAGLAISGEGGLSQAKPVASAIVGKDGVAYSAPSGTAIAGSSNIEQSLKSS